MASLFCVTSFALVLASFADAASQPARSSFTLQQVVKRASSWSPPAAAYAKALRKYSADVPVHVAVAANATGSATATPAARDEYYLTPVQVGQQTLNLDIDTGSSDLWVYSSEMSQSERGSHAFYKPGKTARKLNGSSWSITYGDGSSASGDVYTDLVTVGGLTVNSQAVEAAKQVSEEFSGQSDTDGLFGFGFDNLNTIKPKAQKTWFSNIADKLRSPIFAAALSHQAPGSYDFGFADSNKYKGSLHWTAVDPSKGWWEINADNWAINNTRGNFVVDGIVDTGTSLLLLPTSIVQAFYNSIEGGGYNLDAGGYTFPCNATVPPFSLYISGFKATVPPSELSYSPLESGSPTCYGGIQSNEGMIFSIFGDIWIKSQYIVFNATGPTIGVAARR